jgi:hypothetical protein
LSIGIPHVTKRAPDQINPAGAENRPADFIDTLRCEFQRLLLIKSIDVAGDGIEPVPNYCSFIAAIAYTAIFGWQI